MATVLDAAIEGLTSLASPFVQPIFVQILYWSLSTVATVLSLWEKGDRTQDENDVSSLNKEPQTYDFIVVGGGSAGAVVANRLARANFRTLLLEAGGDPNPFQFIPLLGMLLLNFKETDWMHRTVPQKYASLNSVNQQSSWSTGNSLGGTGTINLMVFLRGHRKDFDNWAKVTGYDDWSWEGVLPHFKSFEDYEILGDEVNHGYNGDLRVEAPDHVGLAPEFVRAGGELGYPNVDLNAPYVEGFDVIRYPIKRGVRQATYKAFIEPVRTLNTLTIMKFSHVNKILFREDNVAYGVMFDRHGVQRTAFASKEVILSSGTVGSAKLLMLSGVGPKKHLQDLSIPVISDLPVGKNLQDHIGVYLGPFFINQPRATYLERDVTPSAVVKWFTVGKGPLSSTGCEGTGLFSSNFAKERGEGNWPDIHLFLYTLTLFPRAPSLLAHAFHLKNDEMEKYYRNAMGIDSTHVVVSGARPFARGYIKLGGSSPYDSPIIDPNYLGDQGVDLEVLLEGVKKSMVLMENTTAFANLGARFTNARLPGCEKYEFRSDNYFKCFIRRYTITLHHPVGTASLGKVVDSRLRVFGTKNLRVIDSSIQPVIVTTNTQASAIMIGEKGANMIINEWRNLNGQNQQISRSFLTKPNGLNISSKLNEFSGKLGSVFNQINSL